MKNLMLRLWADEGGASAAEYALILAIVSSAIALAAIGLGSAISTRVTAASNCIASTNSAQYTNNCT